MGLEHYHGSAADWRLQLKKNESKTKLVIAAFIGIYLLVGVVADVFVLMELHPQLTMLNCLQAIVTFQVVPFATLIMSALAVISLLITFSLYDRIMLLGTEYHEITPTSGTDLQERQLYNVVEEMKVAAGLKYMPKVFIIEASYMNAFASGYSERSAMVAITRGLMEKLDRAEMQAVMAHELSHIRHHDIKLTLTVVVLSNILLIVMDILFYSVIYGRKNNRDNRLAFVIIVLRYVLPIITVLLSLFLSRTREFMADAGCVELMRDNEPLARALLKINHDHTTHAEQYEQEYGKTPHEQVRQASYLFDPSSIDPVKSVSSMFATHPTVGDRLKALGFKSKN